MNDVITTPEWMPTAQWIAVHTSYGELIAHEWLMEQFHLEYPETGTKEEIEEISFAYLQCVTSMSQFLLEEHQLALQNVRGKGYRVVPPQEQIGVAKDQARFDLHRTLRKYAQRLQHIRYDELDVEQQRRRDDEAAKLTQMRQMMNRTLANK